ncbi:hypothetical protein AB0C21_10475 [Spirillospora sp. NPDC049024]
MHSITDRAGSICVVFSGPAAFYVQLEERGVGERAGGIGDVAVGGVVQEDDILLVPKLLDQISDAVFEDPSVGRQVDPAPGRLVGQEPVTVQASAVTF